MAMRPIVFLYVILTISCAVPFLGFLTARWFYAIDSYRVQGINF